MSTQERVRRNFQEIAVDTICDVLEKLYGIKADVGAVTEMSKSATDRMAEVADVCYGIPQGIVEVRAGVKKYAVDSDDEKAIRVELSMMNTQENRLALAVIGDSTVTLRALQSDVEAALRRDSRAQEKAAAEHPGQLDLADVQPETSDAEDDDIAQCDACSGTGFVTNVDDPQQQDECAVCGGTGEIVRTPDEIVDAIVEVIAQQVPCVACEGTGLSVIQGEDHCAACEGSGFVQGESDTEEAGAEDGSEETEEVDGEPVYEPVDEEESTPQNVTELVGKQRKGRRRAVAVR